MVGIKFASCTAIQSNVKLFGMCMNSVRRASVDTNSDVGKNQADALLNELTKKIEDTYTELKAQQSYDLEKSLDFRGAMDEFRV